MASASLTTGETRFDRFAETASRFVSQASFFFISLVVVSIWMPTIVLFDDVDTWQLVINTATSVLAFLLLALLQNLSAATTTLFITRWTCWRRPSQRSCATRSRQTPRPSAARSTSSTPR
jgi:low affinity Fe/Cu permease